MESGGRQYSGQVPYSVSMWSGSSQQPSQQQPYQQQPSIYYSQAPVQPAHLAYQQQPPPQAGNNYSYPPPPIPGQHHTQPPQLPQMPPSTSAAATELRASASYETSVYVGLEDAPPEFRLAFRVIGEKGQNLEYLSRTTNAKVILRGCGTGIINNKPLHIYVGHATLEGKEEAESLANNLVRAVKEEFSDWLKEKGLSKPMPIVSDGMSQPPGPLNGAARPREMQGLRITRDPGGRVEVRHEVGGIRPPMKLEELRRGESHLGRVEVRQEDSRRIEHGYQ